MNKISQLTTNQFIIMERLKNGDKQFQIAEKMQMSVSFVEKQINAIKKNYGAKTMTDLMYKYLSE